MFTEYFYRKIITMIFYMFSCLRQYTQYWVKTKKKHSLLKKNVDAVCVLSSKTNEYKMVSAYRILSFEMFQRTFCSGCPIWKKKTKKITWKMIFCDRTNFLIQTRKNNMKWLMNTFQIYEPFFVIIEIIRRKTSIK